MVPSFYHPPFFILNGSLKTSYLFFLKSSKSNIYIESKITTGKPQIYQTKKAVPYDPALLSVYIPGLLLVLLLTPATTIKPRPRRSKVVGLSHVTFPNLYHYHFAFRPDLSFSRYRNTHNNFSVFNFFNSSPQLQDSPYWCWF